MRLDSKPDSWEERTSLYAAHLVDRGVQSQTLKTYVSAIKRTLVDDGYIWNDNMVLLNMLTRACKVVNDQVRTRLPIKGSLLELLLFEIQRKFSQTYLIALYQALFMLGYYGMMRVGELTQSEHTLKAKNVHMGRNKEKLLLVLYSSKTHGEGHRPQKIKIVANKHEHKSTKVLKRHFCPFKVINKFINMRNPIIDDDEQFFIFSDGSPVQPVQATLVLRQLLKSLGLQEMLYAMHSFRIGRTSELVNFGYSITDVQWMGRLQIHKTITSVKEKENFFKRLIVNICDIFTDTVQGYDELWLIGDNFFAETVRPYYLKCAEKMFTKESFEVMTFCKSRHDSNDTNMLSRLCSTLALAINERIKLPKFIVVILDDDLLNYLGYLDNGVAKMIGEWIEWIAEKFTELIKLRIENLPPKAVKAGYPQKYWVAPPHHCNFSNNQARTKLINCMEVTFKLYPNIRLIRMKEVWDYENRDMIDRNGRFTPYGYSKYWLSVDSAICFNVMKREQYLARMGHVKFDKINKIINNRNPMPAKRARPQKYSNEDDEMQTFFKRHRSQVNSRKPNEKKLPTPTSPF